GDDLALLLHLLLAPEDAEVLVHRLGELVADLPRALAVRTIEQLLQLALRVRLRGRRDLDRRVRQRPVRGVRSRTLPVRDRLHQRVAAETVRAVDGDARALARRVEAFDRGLAPDVRVDAAHVVVRAGPHGNRLVDRVDAGEH